MNLRMEITGKSFYTGSIASAGVFLGELGLSFQGFKANMLVFALWPVIFYKNALEFSNTLYFT